jgi:hypothetical protein
MNWFFMKAKDEAFFLGIQMFWWARAGALCQLIGASVIAIEIFGENKFVSLVRDVKEKNTKPGGLLSETFIRLIGFFIAISAAFTVPVAIFVVAKLTQEACSDFQSACPRADYIVDIFYYYVRHHPNVYNVYVGSVFALPILMFSALAAECAVNFILSDKNLGVSAKKIGFFFAVLGTFMQMIAS